MKLLIALLALCSPLNAQVIKQTPNPNAATVTTNANLTGPVTSVGNATTIAGPVPTGTVDLSTVTTAIALKVDKAGDTMTGQLTVSGASVTVTGAGGLGVTYGITAGTITVTGLMQVGSILGSTNIVFSSGTTDQTFTLTPWLSVVGSSIPITVTAGNKGIRVKINAQCSKSAANFWGAIALRRDGAFIGPSVNIANATSFFYDAGANAQIGSCSTEYRDTVSIAAGTYTYHLFAATAGGGTFTIFDGWTLEAEELR